MTSRFVRPFVLAALLLEGGLAASVAYAQAEGQAQQDGQRGQRGQRGGDQGPGGFGQRGFGRGGGFGGPGGFGEMLGGLAGQAGGRGMGGFGGGWASIFTPDVTRRDLVTISRALDLDDAQQDVAEVLVMEYEEDFQAALEAARGRLDELRPQTPEDEASQAKRDALRGEMRDVFGRFRAARESGTEIDPQEMDQLRARLDAMREEMDQLRPPRPDEAQMTAFREGLVDLGREWQRERAQLHSTFMTNLQAILTDGQLAEWPEFEWTLRREKYMPTGRLSGERTDLIVLLRRLELGAPAMEDLAEPIYSYAQSLDQALAARETFLDDARVKLIEAFTGQDIDSAAELMAREAELRVRVRDVNETYEPVFAESLRGLVGVEAAHAFEQSWREEAWGRVYRPTQMQRIFDAALQLPDLTAVAAESVALLRAAYESELAEINRVLVDVIRREEPSEASRRLQQFQAGRNGGPGGGPGFGRGGGDDPIRQAFEPRNQLDERYHAELERLLTPEQIAELPPLRRGRGGGPGGGGRGQQQQGAGGPSADQQAQFQQMRQQMIQRFDADGDGELSQEERQAMREAFRNGEIELPAGMGGFGRGGGPGGPGGPNGQGGRGGRGGGDAQNGQSGQGDQGGQGRRGRGGRGNDA